MMRQFFKLIPTALSYYNAYSAAYRVRKQKGETVFHLQKRWKLALGKFSLLLFYLCLLLCVSELLKEFATSILQTNIYGYYYKLLINSNTFFYY
jgi:hypothetical protein